LFNVFCKFITIVKTLQKFAKYIKYKNMKSVINTDIYLNELCSYPENRKVSIVCQGRLYTFTLPDLYKLFNKQLLNSVYVYPYPSKIKNPFTNIVFDTHNLYNIYFAFIEKGFSISNTIHTFYKATFDLEKFKIMHNIPLISNAIKTFLSKDDDDSKDAIYEKLYDMLKQIRYENIKIIQTASRNNYFGSESESYTDSDDETIKYVSIIPRYIINNFDKMVKKYDVIKDFKESLYHYISFTHYDIRDIKERNAHFKKSYNKVIELFTKHPKYGRIYVKRKRAHSQIISLFGTSYIGQDLDCGCNGRGCGASICKGSFMVSMLSTPPDFS